MLWSKIQGLPLANTVTKLINSAVGLYGLSYHNLQHVESMYTYLHYTQEPYNEALDWAVLFHDAVYDKYPNKEFRSAELFIELSDRFPEHTIDKDTVTRLIQATITHEAYDDLTSAIIRADLQGLSDTSSAIANYAQILKESQNLYDVDIKQFAKTNKQFMTALLPRVTANSMFDSKYRVFYEAVADGVSTTIKISDILESK